MDSLGLVVVTEPADIAAAWRNGCWGTGALSGTTPLQESYRWHRQLLLEALPRLQRRFRRRLHLAEEPPEVRCHLDASVSDASPRPVSPSTLGVLKSHHAPWFERLNVLSVPAARTRACSSAQHLRDLLQLDTDHSVGSPPRQLHEQPRGELPSFVERVSVPDSDEHELVVVRPLIARAGKGIAAGSPLATRPGPSSSCTWDDLVSEGLVLYPFESALLLKAGRLRLWHLSERSDSDSDSEHESGLDSVAAPRPVAPHTLDTLLDAWRSAPGAVAAARLRPLGVIIRPGLSSGFELLAYGGQPGRVHAHAGIVEHHRLPLSAPAPAAAAAASSSGRVATPPESSARTCRWLLGAVRAAGSARRRVWLLADGPAADDGDDTVDAGASVVVWSLRRVTPSQLLLLPPPAPE